MSDRDGYIEYFPGTTEPVPACLTPVEVVRMMRLDVVSKPDGTEETRALGDGLRSLELLVSKGLLTPRRFCKSNRFSRQDVISVILGSPEEIK